MAARVFRTIKSRVPWRISDFSPAMRPPVVCTQEYPKRPVGCQQENGFSSFPSRIVRVDELFSASRTICLLTRKPNSNRFRHEDVVAGNLDGQVCSERGGASFEIAEVAIKGRKGRARTDDAKVDRDATCF